MSKEKDKLNKRLRSPVIVELWLLWTSPCNKFLWKFVLLDLNKKWNETKVAFGLFFLYCIFVFIVFFSHLFFRSYKLYIGFLFWTMCLAFSFTWWWKKATLNCPLNQNKPDFLPVFFVFRLYLPRLNIQCVPIPISISHIRIGFRILDLIVSNRQHGKIMRTPIWVN